MLSPFIRDNELIRPQSEPSALAALADKLSYRVNLPEEDRAAILALPALVKAVKPHKYLVTERERTQHSCLILSGYSICSKIVANGARQILAIHMRGQLVDLQAALLRVADHNVQMLTAGKVALISHEAIIDLATRRPAISHAMWIDTLIDASIMREWITNIGRRNARTRIAHLFCEFSLRLKLAGLGRHDQYELPMTQEQLADATGLTPVHVNRTIKGLEADGLITRPNPRSIRIADWRALAEEGDFDSSYLYLRAGEVVDVR